MSWPVPAGVLMTGPRGRYLCWSVLWSAMADAPETQGWDRVWEAAHAGDLSGRAGDLAATVALADLDALAAADELVLVPVLADAAAMAMYWQEPDPVGAPVTARRCCPERTANWRPGGSATLAEERSAARRPADPAANWSGHWWSTPAPSRLAATTRALPGLGAAGLALVEDGPGWTTARCQPVSPRPAARVCEITGPDDWAQLAARYPLEVTRSRRHDWWRVTGWTGTWLIPDYSAVAADYDAIHLTVLGYLTTAGRDLPAAGARTMLAGWDPDTTYWLTDSLVPAGPATRWEQLDDHPVRWIRLADG